MGNVSCCQANSDAPMPESKFKIYYQDTRLSMANPPDSLHDLKKHIADHLDVGNYELRDSSGNPIETNEHYMKEFLRTDVIEYIVIIHDIEDKPENSSQQDVFSTYRYKSNESVFNMQKILFTFDTNSDTHFVINPSKMISAPIALDTQVKLFSDGAWCVFMSEFIFYWGGGAESDVKLMKNAYIMQPNESNYGVVEQNDMLLARSMHAVHAFDNRVYVFGGKDSHGIAMDNFEFFNLEKNVWTALPNLPKLMERISVTEVDRSFYFTDFYSRIVFSYDIDAQTFSRINLLLPQTESKLLASVPNSSLLMVFCGSKFIVVDIKKGKKVLSQQDTTIDEPFWSNCPGFYADDHICFVNKCYP